MNQKLWQSKAFRLLLCLSLLAWATWGPMPASAGTLPKLPAVIHPVAAQPEAVETLNFTAIAAGWEHTCALGTGGGVKCWGNNYYSQLGDGTTTNSSIPMDVFGLASGVTAIAAGELHTCALLSGGGVKCWGNNWYGQLGDGMTMDRSTLVDVVGLASGVTAIAAGVYHTCALLSGGGVKCWGDNEYGQLGDGTTGQSSTPVDVVGLTSGVMAIAAGVDHTCALVSGGGVKCWGSNGNGQLGDDTTTQHSTPGDVAGLTSGVTAIDAGVFHTCALLSSGGVKCWGSNRSGQLGDGMTTQRRKPVDVVGLTSGVTTIDAGWEHTCALVSGGGVKCWGSNGSGQLGDGTTTDRSTPVDVVGLASGVTAIAAGGYHTCALGTGGGVKCWGEDGWGQLGDGTLTQRSMPINVVGITTNVTAIVAGGISLTGQDDNVYFLEHTCALLSSGGVKCWGSNGSGQLGDGTTTDRYTPVDVAGLASGVTAIAAGGEHTCALVLGGGVKCWGENGRGELGDSTTTSRSTPVDVAGLASGVTAIAAGELHTCALLSGGGVKCWGDNWYGQLGDGSAMTDSLTPVDVAGLASGVKAIATGGWHTCALLSSGGVKCWGANGYGQVGDGTWTNSSTPVDVLGLANGVTAIDTGGYHTCALVSGGVVKCWGSNYYGQLGDGTTTSRRTPVDVAGLTSGVTAIAAGELHTCALVSGGGVNCWGDNEFGQLGDGTTMQGITPADVSGLTSGVTSIAAGGWHTCGLVGAGRPKCWGSDENGQLGIGTVLQRTTPVDVAGLSLTINYPTGQPGSFFTITGWNFPAGAQANLSINGQVITSTLEVNPTGSFIFFLKTSGAKQGAYAVTVSANPSASTSFRLANEAPLRSQEGGGQVFIVPNGIAFDKYIYLPLMGR